QNSEPSMAFLRRVCIRWLSAHTPGWESPGARPLPVSALQSSDVSPTAREIVVLKVRLNGSTIASRWSVKRTKDLRCTKTSIDDLTQKGEERMEEKSVVEFNKNKARGPRSVLNLREDY